MIEESKPEPIIDGPEPLVLHSGFVNISQVAALINMGFMHPRPDIPLQSVVQFQKVPTEDAKKMNDAIQRFPLLARHPPIPSIEWDPPVS